MSLDIKTARKLAEKELEDQSGVDAVITYEEETESGWVFYYESKEFVETGRIGSALAGNLPIMINRETGKLSYLKG